ncbi:hypothetical protein E2C01_081774 [Portunus trituberculatus]|uniref:Uncharacterized protein n=1 Tax=Portunus trituberculatus TaxID=210409 RepID=A0A5B7IN97_PORTR|nr:hypothetical protein [Portunus trituberculatus]
MMERQVVEDMRWIPDFLHSKEHVYVLTAHVEGDGGAEWLRQVGIGSLTRDDPVEVLAGQVRQGECVPRDLPSGLLTHVVQQ